jgi:hypothetical protein
MGLKNRLVIDVDDLPADQAASLQRLLDQADFFNLPANLASPALPDEFLYKISVELDSRSHTVQVNETAAPDSLRPLLSELSLRARIHRA